MFILRYMCCFTQVLYVVVKLVDDYGRGYHSIWLVGKDVSQVRKGFWSGNHVSFWKFFIAISRHVCFPWVRESCHSWEVFAILDPNTKMFRRKGNCTWPSLQAILGWSHDVPILKLSPCAAAEESFVPTSGSFSWACMTAALVSYLGEFQGRSLSPNTWKSLTLPRRDVHPMWVVMSRRRVRRKTRVLPVFRTGDFAKVAGKLVKAVKVWKIAADFVSCLLHTACERITCIAGHNIAPRASFRLLCAFTEFQI